MKQTQPLSKIYTSIEGVDLNSVSRTFEHKTVAQKKKLKLALEAEISAENGAPFSTLKASVNEALLEWLTHLHQWIHYQQRTFRNRHCPQEWQYDFLLAPPLKKIGK